MSLIVCALVPGVFPWTLGIELSHTFTGQASSWPPPKLALSFPWLDIVTLSDSMFWSVLCVPRVYSGVQRVSFRDFITTKFHFPLLSVPEFFYYVIMSANEDFLKDLFLIMCMCVGLCTGVQVPTEATRGCFIFWRWSSQVAVSPQHEC